MNTHNIVDLLNKRILVLDGAMGTMIQQHPLTEDDFRGELFADHHLSLKGNNDLLTLTQPALIKSIHLDFLEAGADIIETNTFSSTSVGMHDYAMEDYVVKINQEAVYIAKEAATEYTKKTPHKPRFVAGSIGPTSQTLSISPDVENPSYRSIDFETLKHAYMEQVNALVSAGVDLLLIETIFDTLNAKAALIAVAEVFKNLQTTIPTMVSGTITDASGRTLSGQTPEAFAISVSHFPLLSIGLNCALGADLLLPHLEEIAKQKHLFVSAHPNAGLPNALGEYDETPEKMASSIAAFLDKDLINIVGGCCGTTPEHIKKIAQLIENHPPRKRILA